MLAGCSKSVPEETVSDNPPPPTPIDEIITGRFNSVEILGANGFDPAELTIQKNDLVRWTNNDPKAKDAVITFQYENSREFENSEVIPAQGTWEKVFTVSGTYTYWTVGYGVQGKIVVE